MKNIPTVYELRKQGYKVKVTHVRKFFRFDPRTGQKKEFFAEYFSNRFYKKRGLPKPEKDLTSEEFFLSPNGGETIIEISNKLGKFLGKGVSVCSEDDAYIKKLGIKKAIALALKEANVIKDPYSSIRNFLGLKDKMVVKFK